ncbi:MAG: response regulator [Lacipirellulaceae bacterium]
MNRRVLFVDDDPMLLASMERCLGQKFELDTASGGPQALDKLRADGPIAVVVTDMRMPGMDGVQFVQAARQFTRETVYMMLTGNQDLETALRATNEGSVFRFLCKPCDPTALAAAIEQALRQYELEASERELLGKTFVGAIGILADVIETLEPKLVARSAASEQLLEQLRERLSVAPRWEYKVAAKLAFLGAAMLPEAEREAADSLSVTSPEASAMALRSATSSARLLQRVPRLEVVSRIVFESAHSEANPITWTPESEGEVAVVGGALLRVAQLVEGLARSGLDAEEGCAELRKLLPTANQALFPAVLAVYPAPTADRGVPVNPRDLREGMILHSDLVRSDGATLLRAGRRLTENHVEKLRLEWDQFGDADPVMVTATSFKASYPEFVEAPAR